MGDSLILWEVSLEEDVLDEDVPQEVVFWGESHRRVS